MKKKWSKMLAKNVKVVNLHKGTPLTSTISKLTFSLNQLTKNPNKRKKILELAKEELRILFGR